MKFHHRIQRGLIVSCQAAPGEPFYSPFIMGRLAKAAKMGGAVGICSHSVGDILEIRRQVDLPIFGRIQKTAPETTMDLTPAPKAIEEMIRIRTDVIAIDGTNTQSDESLQFIRKTYPHQLLMANIFTLEEGRRAAALGFDFIATGSAEQTSEPPPNDSEDLLVALLPHCGKTPVIVAQSITTPKKAARLLELGAYAVLLGSAMTDPQWICRRFSCQTAAVLRHNPV